MSFDAISIAREVLDIEANALLHLKNSLDNSFVKSVEVLSQCQGKVIVTGMGKSGQVAKKIAATLASTGTPSFFLHASEAIHGDLGMVGESDVILSISYSGETAELLKVLSIVKRKKLPIISITGRKASQLAQVSDIALILHIEKEACPLGLAPTASTTATLALGDALAVCLLKKKGFKEEDFANLHPGGNLGKKLLVRVQDLMLTGENIPMVFEDTRMKEALMEMTTKRQGCTGVSNGQGELVGVITDGDLRRLLERNESFLEKPVFSIMAQNPKTISQEKLASQALNLMEENKITSLFVCTSPSSLKPVGFLHLHHLIEAKII
ncbi:MAG: KpsF/GutQ family sugar-phosphate isomerase [Deltaproteobacteria bacterium]|nr:KpsF/GutQ family sugar-phosphate isomerase [Deltaproteobacteria bacterium]